MSPRALKPTLPPEDPEYLALWKTFPLCLRCNRRVRPQGMKVADAPNTVSPAGKSICQACYHSQKALDARLHNLSQDPNSDRVQVAKGWSEGEHNVAFWVCGKADSAAEADEILQILGLFEPNRRALDAPVHPNL